MKKSVFALITACALLVPAQAGAKITALEPQVGTSAHTLGEAIMENPAQLSSAELPEYAYEEEEPGDEPPLPTPIGVGDNGEPAPKGLADFPTNGSTYGILSTGDVNTIATTLTNEEPDTSFAFQHEFEGTLKRGGNAHDWTVLKLNVTVPGGDDCVALDYRFLTEEYPEFVGSEFNDAFIAELDSSSWSVGESGELTRPNDFAASPSGKPISVNGLGETAMNPQEAEGTYFDGATGLITTKTPIAAGAHAIYLSVFDSSDSIYDSAVFLDNLRFINEGPQTCKPPTGQQLVIPTPGSPAPPAPPSNAFSLGSSVKFKSGGTSATIVVNVPGPGVLGASSVPSAGSSAARDSSATPRKGSAKGKKKALVVPASVQAAAAGPVSLTVKLSGAGKASLAKHRKLAVPLQITFTPTGGAAATQTKTLTFKKPKSKPKFNHTEG